MTMAIYVETCIRGSMDELWRLTQTPQLHAQWDLRFTDIEYLPRPDDAQPQQFLYATRLGFGLEVRGGGETVGEREGARGERTSALKFWSDDPKSLIREGAGYWRYVPTDDGVRFLTRYDYRVRFGAIGRAFDGLVFRTTLGWGTAWSFDRLRLWIEKGIDPASSLRQSVIHAVARCSLALVWLYQGAVPKLLLQHADELAMLRESGVATRMAPSALQVVGWGEVVFGLVMLALFHQRWHFVLNVALMVLALGGVAIHSPQYLGAAFNPVSLNLLMIAAAVTGWVASGDLPSARCCLRRDPGDER
jgi:hypothetical protein